MVDQKINTTPCYQNLQHLSYQFHFFLFFLRRLSEVCQFITLNGTCAVILININPVKQKVLKIKNYWSWTRKEKPIRRITGAIQRQASQSMHV